ncbi:MAG: hypothetical protein ACLFOY_19160 [Desulfatibacillaceae bacterium]
MSRSSALARVEPAHPASPATQTVAADPKTWRRILGVSTLSPESFASTLPFSLGDTTAGAENELQSVVVGGPENVDLPVTLSESSFMKNMRKRALSGDSPQFLLEELEQFLGSNEDRVWDNSWVRFPSRTMNDFARSVLGTDLLEDKSRPDGPQRPDADKFTTLQNQEEYSRLPVSYLLKISLAQALGELPSGLHSVIGPGRRMMRHFSNDNTSPETFSFHPVPLSPAEGLGMGIAGETARRFLFCQALMQYANRSFELDRNGQRAMVYMAPNPAARQKRLNDLIPDAFYRELFMSPCLSGWDRGEEKHRYMHLCHQVLSRSQLNAVAKLREAQIVVNNLVVLPNTSNTSLANNGTHISLGSRKLTQLLSDPGSGFTAADEKHLGDLAIKITEHFLPLFVGTCSAAPWRLDFADFHPERVLGFLPHELDFTHLRMIWRRWKKKANLKMFGQPITPFGPSWVDGPLRRMLRFSGDYVQDFRLVDYLVALMSTEENPALDGALGNDDRLKRDLSDLGVFDSSMSLYLLYKLREHDVMGFSGFEGRYYSLFESFHDDMALAAGFQTLVTAYAFQLILQGALSHEDVPSDPFSESERRQVFFGAAIGIPSFYVRKDTKNRFLLRVLREVDGIRFSRRYPGYLRVDNREYQIALLTVLRKDAPELVDVLDMGRALDDLERRVRYPDEFSVAGRLTSAILKRAGAKSAMKLSGAEFSQAAERYYREDLRKSHMREGLDFLERDFQRLDGLAALGRGTYREDIGAVFGEENTGAWEFLSRIGKDLVADQLPERDLSRLISLHVMAEGMRQRELGS